MPTLDRTKIPSLPKIPARNRGRLWYMHPDEPKSKKFIKRWLDDPRARKA